MRLPTCLTALPLLLLAVPVAAEEERTEWRLFIADHRKPLVSVVDLDTASTLGTFELAAPATLYTTPSKRAVYAVQGSANLVSAIATGLAVDDHGDHGDITITDPALLDVTIAGERPVHFVEHDGDIAVFFDGEGVVRVMGEDAFLDGDGVVAEYDAGAPHHGVAAAFDGHLLISAHNPADPSELPVGIRVLDAGGQQVGDLHDCPDLHGEASSNHTLAIACATGLLLVNEGANGPEIEHLAYSESLPEGKTTTLLGGVGLQYWLGNYGADRVVIIDPSGSEAFRLVDLPTRRVHFAVDPQNVKFAYIFTEDGALHQLNVLSGSITKSLQVTEPYSMDGEWSLPRPRIAVAGDVVAVTDPLKSVVRLIGTGDFTEAGLIAVEGMPYNIVAVGASGEVH
jgi:hypothetical protein